MKEQNPTIGLAKICWLFGVTRQAYYQKIDGQIQSELVHELLIQEVQTIRKKHRKIGTRKLYGLLNDFMLDHQIKMGRDALFNLLSVNGLLIRRRRRMVKTTQSHHWLKKYPNLIKEFTPMAPNELWVSDITYWKVIDEPWYISFITDAYSHKIVGYYLSDTLEAESSLEALKMALSAFCGAESHLQKLIHHSDRGVQYCSAKYVGLLDKYNTKISMTENGNPRENSVAERVNGIIKNEYLFAYNPQNIYQAKEILNQIVNLYNKERPHMSNGNIVPEDVHNNPLKKGNKLWKNYYQKNQTVNQF
jgi:putative transposase